MTVFDTPVLVRWVETTLFYRGEGTQLNIAEAVGFIEEDNKHMLKLAMCQSRLPDDRVAQTYVSVGIPKGSIVFISEMEMKVEERPMDPWETVAGNEALQRFREAGANKAASAPIFADVRGVLDDVGNDHSELLTMPGNDPFFHSNWPYYNEQTAKAEAEKRRFHDPVIETAPHDNLATILKNIPDGDWRGTTVEHEQAQAGHAVPDFSMADDGNYPDGYSHHSPNGEVAADYGRGEQVVGYQSPDGKYHGLDRDAKPIPSGYQTPDSEDL